MEDTSQEERLQHVVVAKEIVWASYRLLSAQLAQERSEHAVLKCAHASLRTEDKEQSKVEIKTRTSPSQTKFKASVLHDLASVLAADMATLSVAFFAAGVTVVCVKLICRTLIADVDEKHTETHRKMQEHHRSQCEDSEMQTSHAEREQEQTRHQEAETQLKSELKEAHLNLTKLKCQLATLTSPESPALETETPPAPSYFDALVREAHERMAERKEKENSAAQLQHEVEQKQHEQHEQHQLAISLEEARAQVLSLTREVAASRQAFAAVAREQEVKVLVQKYSEEEIASLRLSVSQAQQEIATLQALKQAADLKAQQTITVLQQLQIACEQAQQGLNAKLQCENAEIEILLEQVEKQREFKVCQRHAVHGMVRQELVLAFGSLVSNMMTRRDERKNLCHSRCRRSYRQLFQSFARYSGTVGAILTRQENVSRTKARFRVLAAKHAFWIWVEFCEHSDLLHRSRHLRCVCIAALVCRGREKLVASALGTMKERALQHKSRLAEEIYLRYKSLAIRPAMLRWRLCVSRRKRLARCEDKVECRMLRMKLWSPFAKLERVKLLSRDFDARICGCVIRWERVEASKASVSMRLFRNVFFAWHVHKTLGQQVKAKAFGSFVTCAMEAKRKRKTVMAVACEMTHRRVATGFCCLSRALSCFQRTVSVQRQKWCTVTRMLAESTTRGRLLVKTSQDWLEHVDIVLSLCEQNKRDIDGYKTGDVDERARREFAAPAAHLSAQQRTNASLLVWDILDTLTDISSISTQITEMTPKRSPLTPKSKEAAAAASATAPSAASGKSVTTSVTSETSEQRRGQLEIEVLILATENLEVSSISSRLRCACLQQRNDNDLLKSALEKMTAKRDTLQLNLETLQHFHKRASDQQQNFQSQSVIQSVNKGPHILKKQGGGGGGGGGGGQQECGSELQNKEDEKDCSGETIFASDMSLEAHSLKSMLLEESLSQVIPQSAWKEEFMKHDMLKRQWELEKIELRLMITRLSERLKEITDILKGNLEMHQGVVTSLSCPQTIHRWMQYLDSPSGDAKDEHVQQQHADSAPSAAAPAPSSSPPASFLMSPAAERMLRELEVEVLMLVTEKEGTERQRHEDEDYILKLQTALTLFTGTATPTPPRKISLPLAGEPRGRIPF